MSKPFEKLAGNPIWTEYVRQADASPDRVNLTGLWRIACRKRSWSPRQYAKTFDRGKDIAFEGRTADGPAWSNEKIAMHYVQMLDVKILQAVGEAFMAELKKRLVEILMDSIDHGCGDITAIFVSGLNSVNGSRTEGDRRIVEEATKLTDGLDVYDQETKIAKVQRALSEERSKEGIEWSYDRR